MQAFLESEDTIIHIDVNEQNAETRSAQCIKQIFKIMQVL
jgi:hypothetical protein